MDSTLILACSPRAHGNSDHMAQCFAKGIQSQGGTATLRYLREAHIMPCIACGACFTHPEHQCVFAEKDDVQEFFEHIQKAQLVFLAVPIFFYHVPTILKAFIDRAQCLYAKRQHSENTEHMVIKPVHVGFVAARKKGEKLFAGSTLTLQYFFELFHRNIQEVHPILGYDSKNDFANDAHVQNFFFELGAQCQKNLVTTC